MIELADEDRFLTTREAATFLCCSVRTLARWRAEGSGPSYLLGSKILYPLTELRSFMANRRIVHAGGVS